MNPIALLSPPASTDARMDALSQQLVALVAREATTEGLTQTLVPGLRFHRVSRPSPFKKWTAVGPSLTVVVQGSKVATHRGVKLAYDAQRYLVVTGEAEFEGNVLEATPQRPGLSICLQLPPDVVVKTLLALARADSTPPLAEPVPAFVGALDAPIAECVIRLLCSLADPTERAVVAPLAIEELVFRLLRTDAATALRSAVQPDRDADKMRQAMAYMRANLERAVAVEDVAHHVAMSPSHFAHRFRAVARVSPMRYLKGLRLIRARSLLLTDGARVSDAAVRCGYESASHFTRDFKLTYGTSPSEYVRRFRGSQD